ncbi:MAG: hypothetical protein QOF88_4669 [Mycobacterium sp.]|nr:hypothetical protein [Mycobacterium sp.]
MKRPSSCFIRAAISVLNGTGSAEPASITTRPHRLRPVLVAQNCATCSAVRVGGIGGNSPAMSRPGKRTRTNATPHHAKLFCNPALTRCSFASAMTIVNGLPSAADGKLLHDASHTIVGPSISDLSATRPAAEATSHHERSWIGGLAGWAPASARRKVAGFHRRDGCPVPARGTMKVAPASGWDRCSAGVSRCDEVVT